MSFAISQSKSIFHFLSFSPRKKLDSFILSIASIILSSPSSSILAFSFAFLLSLSLMILLRSYSVAAPLNLSVIILKLSRLFSNSPLEELLSCFIIFVLLSCIIILPTGRYPPTDVSVPPFLSVGTPPYRLVGTPLPTGRYPLCQINYHNLDIFYVQHH